MTTASFKPIDPEHMARITSGLPTKSAKIRVLSSAGYRRADIASFLGIRYQHVRNVLLQPGARRERTSESPDVDSSGRGYLADDGHVSLPEDALRRLETRPGGVIPWRAVEHGEVILMSPSAGLRLAQQIAAPYVQAHPESWADSLIADRRAEAEREANE